MADRKYIIGTSGYSFKDWVGTFYPDGTQARDMLGCYVQHFETVELNFSYYRMPSAATLDAMARKTPDGFNFWIKANQETTHKQNRAVAGEFLESLSPMISRDKLAGVLMQFPQSFHRTVANRKYLAATLEDFASVPTAVEFRHFSWVEPSAADGLRQRNVTLVIPDVPELDGLYRSGPLATSSTGYLRLHFRNASKWYAGGAERYDWNYTTDEIKELLDLWSDTAAEVDKMYTFFNNCHRGQAAKNAEAMRQILQQI
ncbi:MAG: DUF72 domain-containing protein [Phycisphaerae bacterium]|jgi:uncharacterized protein YecE (DUF72 family)|nr:DUF72 domain-containing protein [Phycisphaerae bacterium]